MTLIHEFDSIDRYVTPSKRCWVRLNWAVGLQSNVYFGGNWHRSSMAMMLKKKKNHNKSMWLPSVVSGEPMCGEPSAVGTLPMIHYSGSSSRNLTNRHKVLNYQVFDFFFSTCLVTSSRRCCWRLTGLSPLQPAANKITRVKRALAERCAEIISGVGGGRRWVEVVDRLMGGVKTHLFWPQLSIDVSGADKAS